MAKNNKLINSLNEIARRNRAKNINSATNQMVPQIYAAIALALHRTYGFGHKRINDVFVESQHIWERFEGCEEDMIKYCEKVTGITVHNSEKFEKIRETEKESRYTHGNI